ncbi:hypothetical protein BJX63DRAFT_426583 [Aspergillus granulosus]|uniref:Uncharacterized protein n=1 Tax=Aspergillus granulosus TaxID=176169 RepID=A0ABR4GS18_9EURO
MSVPLFIFAATIYLLDRLVSKYSRTRQIQLVQKVQEVVGTIILLKSPLSVTSLSKLMEISIISINARLNSLHSVLNIPNNNILPVRLFHLSFQDFLLNSSTRNKTAFWNLKKNIYNLKSYRTERSNINPKSINYYLPPELHKDPIGQADNILAFLKEHFLHWVEVISMLGKTSEVVEDISTLQSVIQAQQWKKLKVQNYKL